MALVIKPCKCRSQWCPDCHMGYVVRWRERFRPAMKDWKRARMVTLTTRRDCYSGPAEAYESITKRRRIAELAKELRRRGLTDGPHWFCAFEVHADEEGWPHWHVVFQAGFLKHAVVEKIWGEGIVYVSPPKTRKVAYAINYATKYLIKPGASIPPWILEYPKEIRRISTSRGFFGEPVSREKKKPIAPVNGKPFRNG